jgi:hypothetical protein
MIRRFTTALSLVIVLGWCVFAAAAADPVTVTVVMSGLDNPRGLVLGPEGAVYVAEAGRGGPGPCQTMSATREFRCYGPTGAITRLRRGVQTRVVTGLPSHATPTGATAAGPNDISFQGHGAYLTIGLGGTPAERANFGPGAGLFGTLARLDASGKVHEAADIAEYQATVNPGGGGFDSNPFGLLAEHRSRVVTDAGGNALLRIKADGTISTLAVFPSRAQGRSTDAVPTSVVVGPDDAYYVGELSGGPFATGAANVYRVEPGHAPQVVLAGFTTIIDLAFGPDDSLYVLEHSTGPAFFARPGQITRVAPDGTRSIVYGGLIRPTSLLVDDDGTIYVTNNAVAAGVGQVLKIEQEHAGHHDSEDDDRDSRREDRP